LQWASGQSSFREAEKVGVDRLLKAGFSSVDYFAYVCPETLLPAVERPARLIAAATVGGVRLIDNVAAP
jgi:pantoate--beta-alanine ligase